MIRVGWLVATLPNPCQLTDYLEDHPRTCKWLGSPPFVSYTVRPFGRVVPQPCQASLAFIQAQVKATVDATSKDLGLNSDKVSFGEKFGEKDLLSVFFTTPPVSQPWQV